MRLAQMQAFCVWPPACSVMPESIRAEALSYKYRKYHGKKAGQVPACRYNVGGERLASPELKRDNPCAFFIDLLR